mgnify:CR=1 FL=1
MFKGLEILKTEPLKAGFLATDHFSATVVEKALPEVHSLLRSSFSEFTWKCERENMEEIRQEPLKTLPLFDTAYVAMLEKGWDFCFLVTSKRLDPAESPSGWMKVSLSHSTTVISVHRLLPLSEESGLVETAFINLFLEAFGRLNGLKKGGLETFAVREIKPYSAQEREEITRRLHELARVLPRERLNEVSRIFYYLWVAARHPVWLARATFSHRPWTVVYRSTRLLFVVLATMVISLATAEFWELGMKQSVWRTSLLGLGVVVLSASYVIWRHHLLVHAGQEEMKEQVAIYKMTTVLTVLLSFACLFAVLFLVNLSVTLAVFPRSLVSRWLAMGTEKVPLNVYFRVSLSGSCLALVVGALGAGMEESQDFRYLIYGSRVRGVRFPSGMKYLLGGMPGLIVVRGEAPARAFPLPRSGVRRLQPPGGV